jgi:two-component system CheB/CheR fusion protein
MPDEADNPQFSASELPSTAGRTNFPIVGIGASAGGVDALRRLFPNVDPGCGLAFVVVLHLDPDRGSMLAEVLGRSTSLPVSQIENDTRVEPGHVYVIPSNASLTIHNGTLRLAALTAPRGHRNVIDEFFTSLAGDQGENTACVILSGTGSDGTIGLRAIKENGGLTLAQSEAQYDGMMRNAVATGLVDFILRAENIPAKLADYFGRMDDRKRQSKETDPADYLMPITALLRAHTGHDFSNYKERTIERRIERRMHVLQLDDVATYLDRLRRESSEISLLFQDLLIGVTHFFRDPAAFAALEREVIPHLFDTKGADDTVRVWVPGCATGEEAYSIAMMLRQAALKSHGAPKLQVFASDIDEHALEIARMGRYPATIAKDVPAEILQLYFLREDGTYKVINNLREICLFSAHNLLRDAPFSRLDLISCRNLLIYFNNHLQNRVIPLFHYALRPNGYLFLGTSENVTRHSRLFVTVDKSHRIFQRRTLPERNVPQFPLTPADTIRQVSLRRSEVAARGNSLQGATEQVLLEHFTPAYAVVNKDGDLLQSSGRTGKYLELPSGVPDTNIFNMARRGLRLELSVALRTAINSEQPVIRPKISIGTDGGHQEIDLYVRPLRFEPPLEPVYLIVFQDLGGIRPIADPETFFSDEEGGDSRIRQLEAELRANRDRLQTTSEELETANEELKSSNEELQSINEELQSANEELETSKEELQSINEELQTVNAELNAKVAELSEANNDVRNLLESTQIATVFLDRMLVVKNFTPAARELFRLVESDAGRPITDVRQRFDYDDFQEDLERVLRDLGTVERSVKSNESDTRYVMRILPYQTAEHAISGVVITFTDVTRILAAEARIEELTENLRARVDELETILDLVPVGVMIAVDDRNPDVLINTYGARLLGAEQRHRGLKPSSTLFRLFEDGQELPRERNPLERAARAGETVSNWQGRLEPELGDSAQVMISAIPLFTEGGVVRGAVAAMVDISRLKQAEDQQQLLLSELQHRVKNILATISSLAMRMSRGRSLDQFKEAFLSRLGAMSRTHDVLACGAWSGASLRSLLDMALEPYATADKRNLLLTGPELKIGPNAATTLGMILHELATNAAKYGALSTPEGRAEVSWETISDQASDQQLVRLTWMEHGGPPVDRPGPAGFGTSFIKRAVEYELLGRANMELAPEGLRCCITFPTAGNVDEVAQKEIDAFQRR